MSEMRSASKERRKKKVPVHPSAVASLKALWAEQADIDEERWAFRQSAAVLDTFDPNTIQPFDVAEQLSAYPEVEEDAVKIAGDDEGKWRLQEDIRREALQMLGDRNKMRVALEKNPDAADSDIQRMIRAIISRKALTVESKSRDELRSMLTVCRWFEDALPLGDLPTQNEIASAFARADLLAPCHHLLADGFVGRTRQIQKLRNFVWSDEPSQPMMLYGIGGVGKSTLLAKLAVDESAESGEKLLYVPIDVDRPSVRPHRPHTFLVEAATQVIRQVPDLEAFGESLILHLRELGARYSTSDEGHEFESVRYSEKNLPYLEEEMVVQFDEFLKEIPRHARALITIDTFEEAQVQGSEVASHIVRLFTNLASRNQSTRVIFSGRIRADQPEWMGDQVLPGAQKILLKGLDKRSAETLLSRLCKEAEVHLAVADRNEIIGLVGRNPMCIKLAAQVINVAGPDALLSEESRAELLASLRDAKIQGFLFGRILDHFQTQRIRPVTYPGLIVRRVTPEIIQDVLAGPCGIELQSASDAQELFGDLGRERTLVEPDGFGGLRYRPDLRQELLPDVLEKVDKYVARAIDKNAVEYYSKLPTREDRAEEIYHLLRLEDMGEVEARWQPGMRQLLRSSLSELPNASRVWLSQKLNITADVTTRARASQSDWEKLAALSAERLLRSGNADKALKAVRERSGRLENSKLFALEAEALRLDGQIPKARQSIDRGLRSASGEARIDLLFQRTSLFESENDLDEALLAIAEAGELAGPLKDRIQLFRAEVTRLRLLRKAGRNEERNQLLRQVTKNFDNSFLKKLRKYPRLMEEAAAELGAENTKILAAAAEKLGVQVRSDKQREALADVFHEGWTDELENKVRVPKTLNRTLVRKMGTSIDAAEEVVSSSEGAGLGRFAADLVKTSKPNSRSSVRLADYFRDSVEQGLNLGNKVLKR